MEYGDKSLKAQMKQANRLGVGQVLIVGESELKAGTVVLRNMNTKTQQRDPLTPLDIAIVLNATIDMGNRQH
jgi:histidyl-tRNA synthetase